jgi:hypothetical protein
MNASFRAVSALLLYTCLRARRCRKTSGVKGIRNVIIVLVLGAIAVSFAVEYALYGERF